ncbi:ZIP family metal transporter [Salirhabdus sp. Marseille-P4669]|uniref:ZIP family metal transporter n=1 Tax=Salirhabdus sp. Marseille-P4669 TaxID=2042310 RepID=UPI000C7DAFDD|nr:ZIP family metal transporter [Salirhabdus sp. Marseille-P4669]
MNEVLVGSFLSAFATGLGALPILFLKKVSHRWRDILLAFAAGIMMTAAMMSLVPEALNTGSLIQLTVGMILGIVTLTVLEKNIPHIHVEDTSVQIEIDQKAMLIIAAITLHNIPEGLSVGVSYSGSEEDMGNLVALAIGLQNAPEGFIVALFLATQNVPRVLALLIATLTGAIEIVTSIIGYSLTRYFTDLVPYGLAFAAGAMLFIIYKELIPESHGDGNERVATYSFIIGILSMISLIQYFG